MSLCTHEIHKYGEMGSAVGVGRYVYIQVVVVEMSWVVT